MGKSLNCLHAETVTDKEFKSTVGANGRFVRIWKDIRCKDCGFKVGETRDSGLRGLAPVEDS